MAETRTCTQCGGELPADAPQGMCPLCLLDAGSNGRNPTAAYPPTSAAPGTDDLSALFPQLEILGLVGRGGMGVVYKARQPNLDRLVALKILPGDVGRDPAFAERFGREARALARLNHPNIVAVYDSGHVGDLYYFLMEYVDGVNLRQAILADQITPAKALAIVPQICDALQYAHEEGVVHRDIKPENVLLDRRGRVKVADFGLAKLLGLATPEITLTGTSQAMGTLHYMAPEQYEKPQSVDHRADIFSLGVVFYELLTGKLPLGRFELPSHTLHVDVRLDQVVLKTLEREPERRYQHVSQVKTDVEQISREAPLPPVPAEAVRAAAPDGGPGLPNSGRRMLILGLVGLLAMPLLCSGGLLLSRAGVFGVSGMELLLVLGGVVVFVFVTSLVLIVAGAKSKPGRVAERLVPPEKAIFAAQANREEIARVVQWPAFALLILALLDLAALVFPLAMGDGVLGGSVSWFMIFALVHLAATVAIGVGAMCMRQMRAYPLAMLAAVLAMLPLHFTGVVGLGFAVGIWALNVLTRGDVRMAFGVSSSQGAASPVAAIVVVLVVLGVGVVALPVLLVGGYFFSSYGPAKSQSTYVMEPPQWTKTPDSMPHPKHEDPWVALTWTDGLPHTVDAGSQFDAAQLQGINAALLKARQRYLEMEQKHVERKTNELGHQVVTLAAFEKELNQLENEFWTEVDAVVMSDLLRGRLREQLPLRGQVFPYGSTPSTLEMWKVGAWFHWKPDGYNSSRGPELPQGMRHLWQEEAKRDE